MRLAPELARLTACVGLLCPLLATGCGPMPVASVPASDTAPATEAKPPATEAKPPATEAKPAATRPKAESAANLKALWEGMCDYQDVFQRLPHASIIPGWPKTQTPISWRVRILPFIGQEPLYRSYRQNEPWDSPANQWLIPRMPAIFAPVGGKAAAGETFYQLVVGPGTPFEGGGAAPLTEFRDGAANTILVAEAATPVVWTKPDDIPFDPAGDAPKVGGMFGGEFRALMADGSLRTSKPGYDPAELKKAVTLAGGEAIDAGKLWAAGPTPVAAPPAPPAAPKTQPMTDLHRIVLAVHSHFDTYKRLPTNVAGPDGKPLLSWRVALLPMLDQEALFNEFRRNEPWDSDHNKKLLARMPAVYAAPPGKGTPGETFYQSFVGPGTVFEPGKPLRLYDCKDGTANTILVAEAPRSVVWTKPDDIPFDPTGPAPKLAGGFRCVMADCTVRTAKPDYDPAELKKAITRAGGETIDTAKLWAGDPVPLPPDPPRPFAPPVRPVPPPILPPGFTRPSARSAVPPFPGFAPATRR